MKHKIVLVPFPFDDLSTTKVRPAVCLTDEISPYGHVVLAFVTSRVSEKSGSSELIIDTTDKDFAGSGTKGRIDHTPSPFDDSNHIDHSPRTR